MAAIDVRQTASGPRYDVRFRDPAGHQHKKAFRTKKEAERFAVTVEADRWKGQWVDPAAGKITLDAFASTWLQTRPKPLRPRTRELYDGQLRLHVLPVLGAYQLSRISPADVRAWHAGLVRSCGSSSIVPAKCYRLLRAILTTAVDDELIARNPCVLKRAGVERASERPVASAAQVWELSEAVDERYRSLVLLAGFAGLRLGELLGLQRRDLDLSRAIVTVERQMQELSDSSFVVGPPKTDAGARTLTLPPLLVDELALHIGGFVEDDQEALIFTGVKGGPLRRHVWNTCWRKAVIHSSLPNEFRFHDLRHTANTLAAATPGISTKDLMHRMGHASDRAALLYQHATSRQDAAIASAIDAIAEGARTSPHSRRLKALDRPANS